MTSEAKLRHRQTTLGKLESIILHRLSSATPTHNSIQLCNFYHPTMSSSQIHTTIAEEQFWAIILCVTHDTCLFHEWFWQSKTSPLTKHMRTLFFVSWDKRIINCTNSCSCMVLYVNEFQSNGIYARALDCSGLLWSTDVPWKKKSFVSRFSLSYQLLMM